MKEELIADFLREQSIIYRGRRWFLSHALPTLEKNLVIMHLELPDPPEDLSAMPYDLVRMFPEFPAKHDKLTGVVFAL